MKNFTKLSVAVVLSMQVACAPGEVTLKDRVAQNGDVAKVDSMARAIVASGFNAGDSYGEVWIRDYNTFISLSMEVMSDELVRDNLNHFFRFQGEDGDIVDGVIPITQANFDAPGGYKYRRSELDPNFAAHKNTVETDQETSLIQAVHSYVTGSGNRDYLSSEVGGKSVLDRLEWALEWLYGFKMNQEYGLIIGATTADWGDVQPEHVWGVAIDENTHYAIDIYDNAMLVIAIDNFIELASNEGVSSKWQSRLDALKSNIREHLWDEQNQKYIPHIYLDGSPFPANFDESKVYYHGGTAVAIQAKLMTKEEVEVSYAKMLDNVAKAHAQTIGLTLYPTYPAGTFLNKGMYPYGYQNGGDWTWFGARMINGLLGYDMAEEAYTELIPMLSRVVENNGFYEWYTPAGEPMGSGTFRGEAGVLYSAIVALNDWLETNGK